MRMCNSEASFLTLILAECIKEGTEGDKSSAHVQGAERRYGYIWTEYLIVNLKCEYYQIICYLLMTMIWIFFPAWRSDMICMS